MNPTYVNVVVFGDVNLDQQIVGPYPSLRAAIDDHDRVREKFHCAARRVRKVFSTSLILPSSLDNPIRLRAE